MTHKRVRSSFSLLTAATLLFSHVALVLFGKSAQAHGSGTGPADAKDPGKVSAQGGTSLCTPIFGTGKSTGVPITVQDGNGATVSDISTYTFELSDGTNTQDVTSLIKTPAQEQLVVGQVVVAPYGNSWIGKWGQTFHNYGQGISKTGPTLDYSNPGYFFLDCTPDATSSSVKFPAGTTLRMKSGGTVVTSVSIAGRAAAYHAEFARTTDPLQVLAAAVRPAGSTNADLAGMYGSFISTVGVRLREAFAATAVMEVSRHAGNGNFCYDDLVTVSGSNWSWNAAGRAYLDELISPANSSWPVFSGRTTGTSGPVYAPFKPCDVSGGMFTTEADYFINALTAQLLLIDGPLGNIPASVKGSIDAFAPASILRLPSVATTTVPPSTTTVASTTTVPTTTAPTTTMPSSSILARLPAGQIIGSSSAGAGSNVTVSAPGFTPGESVGVFLSGQTGQLATLKARSSGRVSGSIRIPTGVTGRRSIALFGFTSKNGRRQTITITDGGAGLPVTGTSTTTLWPGILVIWTGMLLLGVRRRSRWEVPE